MKNNNTEDTNTLEQDIDIESSIGENDFPEDEFQEEISSEALQAEIEKLKGDVLRAYADGENIKKRCASEIEKNNKYAISSFAKELLSVADNLQRAIDSVAEDVKPSCQGILQGVELTQGELTKIFSKFGVEKMDIMGKVFDPNYHQVVQQVADAGKPSGTVIAELQSGYMIKDRILREAMVVVTTGGK